MNLDKLMVEQFSDSSFINLLERQGMYSKNVHFTSDEKTMEDIPHGTTIVACKFKDGVILAGDRQVTAGYSIAHSDFRKVFITDQQSAIGITGTAGPAIEMTKMFELELEHYEKIEGRVLSFPAKVNRLSQFIRQNFQAAMNGLVVIPIFVGKNLQEDTYHIHSFDITGGTYEHKDFTATGSGGIFAENSLREVIKPNMTKTKTIESVLLSLYRAGNQDIATSNANSNISYSPIVVCIDSDGIKEIDNSEVSTIVRKISEQDKK